MSDVNAYVYTPDQYKADALVIAAGNLDFTAGFSTTGNAPITGWMSGGMFPKTVRDAFAADARFTVYNVIDPEVQTWRTFAAGLGVLRVVSP